MNGLLTRIIEEKIMAKREKKLPLPTPLERKVQGERAKKGLEPVKQEKRIKTPKAEITPFGKGIYTLSEGTEYKLEPGGIWRYSDKGKLVQWGYGWDTGALEKIRKGNTINEKPKNPTEEWVKQWEKQNG